jgi:hypothetical protein
MNGFVAGVPLSWRGITDGWQEFRAKFIQHCYFRLPPLARPPVE